MTLIPLPPRAAVRPLVPDGTADTSFALLSPYVEACWLPVLGPTATTLLRRLGFLLAAHPRGTQIDVADFAQCIGLSRNLCQPRRGIGSAIWRLSMFGMVKWENDQLFVRLRVKPVPASTLRRLPGEVRAAHDALLAAAARANLGDSNAGPSAPRRAAA